MEEPATGNDQPAVVDYQPVVTFSASYSAGGSIIAPALAERLGVPFVDRLLTVDITEQARRTELEAGPPERSAEEATDAEKAGSPGGRLFSYLARAASVGTLSAPPIVLEPDEDLRTSAEEDLAAIKAGGPGVVLGRAGAVVLARRPNTLNVRLDGPIARRIRTAMRTDGITEEEALRRQTQTDRSRILWVKRLYRADAADPAWYHLWIDATVITHADALDLVSLTLERFLAARQATGPTGPLNRPAGR